ncbi:MAG: hypothetical protein KJ578_15135 [Bacteroidetes bacterium]|nr:hypothetical protein [Bacteroidota bacterium]MBU1580888.1 hypothetical protein [Bacteroidota bacterium]MBU2559112.1 hypothetical protein [Bacteroidota bacterium]
MRKNHVTLLILFMAIATAFSSCKKDDDILNPEPSIDFKGGGEYTSTDVTINTNEQILVGFNAAFNQETNEDLQNFKLTLTSNNVAQTLIDSTLNTEVFTTDITITFPEPVSARLDAVITDKAGRTASVSFNITVEEAGVKVVKHTDVELGSWNDEIGSFYNAEGNLILNVNEAFANQAKVDLVFYKGVTNFNTIAAPADASLNTIQTFNMDSWTTRNATLFIKTDMTAEEFDAIGEYHLFPEFNESAADTKAVDLLNGEVLLFKTEANAMGYIKVVDFYSRGDLGKFDMIIME